MGLYEKPLKNVDLQFAFCCRGNLKLEFLFDPVPIEKLSVDEIGSIEGVGKGIQAKISDLLARSSFPEMDEMLE